MKQYPSLTHHAHSRACERFGTSFAQMKVLAKDIETGKAEFVRTKGTNEIWILKNGTIEIPVVWDPKDKTIVTVLPKFALRELHRELVR